jgi:hypothetical protein
VPRGYDHIARGDEPSPPTRQGAAMTDYWLSKLFFDLQHDPQLAAAYRADMTSVIDRYEIRPPIRQALLADDVAVIAPLVNAYLLRFYFQIRGMPEAEFIARLHAIRDERAEALASEASGQRGNVIGARAGHSPEEGSSARDGAAQQPLKAHAHG